MNDMELLRFDIEVILNLYKKIKFFLKTFLNPWVMWISKSIGGIN